jgi:L-ascorbate metabolism protein UlaG (beta-lactamase superfamily)
MHEGDVYWRGKDFITERDRLCIAAFESFDRNIRHDGPLALPALYGLAYHQHRILRSGDASLDKENIPIGHDIDHAEI